MPDPLKLLETASGNNFLTASWGRKLLWFLRSIFNIRVYDSDGVQQQVDYSEEDVSIYLKIKGGVSGGGGDWFKGDYNPATTYNSSDGVQLDPSAATIRATIAGTYVCTVNGTVGVTPKHPLAAGYTGTPWRLLSTWPTEETGCDDTGNLQTYFTDTQIKPEP